MPTKKQLQRFAQGVGKERFSSGEIIVEPYFAGSIYQAESSWVGDTLQVSLRWANMSGNTAGKAAYFVVKGCLGRIITFDFRKWTGEAGTLSNSANQYPSWSYDNVNWTQFDNRTTTSGVQGWNNNPFTQDIVYVSMYPYSGYREFMDWIRTRVFPHRLVRPSPMQLANGSFEVIPKQPARTSLDKSVGRARPEQPFYSFLIGTGSKTIVLQNGIHSAGESRSKEVFQSAVNFILFSGEQKAQTAREVFTWLVYPHLNPVAEMCGGSRGAAQDMTIDGNRLMQSVSPSPYQEQYKIAFTGDVSGIGNGIPRLAMDTHQHQVGGPFLIFLTGYTDNDRFANRVTGYNPTFGKNNIQGITTGQGTHANYWNENVGCPISITHETWNSDSIANCRIYGSNFIKAIVDSHEAGEI